MKMTRTGLLCLCLLLLLAPWLQRQLHVFNPPDLHGSYTPSKDPVLTDSSWFSGEFQVQKTRSVNEQIGFRSDFVRLFNQIDFSLFSLSHANGILVGKEGYLFFEEGIYNLTGRYNQDPGFYRDRVTEYTLLKEYLMKKSGIPLILVIAPDKAHYYPEYIPDRYLKRWNTSTKYQTLIRELNDAGVDYLDFNRYFMQMKDTSKYTLYPKSGSHWGSLGAIWAFDSVTRYLETVYGFDLPRRVVDSIVISDKIQKGDGDMTRTMNLAREPDHIDMAYPRYHFTSTGSTDSLNVLFIGDSFFWHWYDEGRLSQTFPGWNLWYYNQGIYPESFTQYKNAYALDLIETLSSYDAIIILQTMGGEGKIGFGFLERGYCEILFPGKLNEIVDQIKKSPKWMEYVNTKATLKGLPVETVLCREAIYCIYQGLKTPKKINL